MCEVITAFLLILMPYGQNGERNFVVQPIVFTSFYINNLVFRGFLIPLRFIRNDFQYCVVERKKEATTKSLLLSSSLNTSKTLSF